MGQCKGWSGPGPVLNTNLLNSTYPIELPSGTSSSSSFAILYSHQIIHFFVMRYVSVFTKRLDVGVW